MLKRIATSILFTIILFSLMTYAETAEEQAIREHKEKAKKDAEAALQNLKSEEERAAAEQMKAEAERIFNECTKDPETCSCATIEQAQARDLCEKEREKGLKQKREALKKAEQLKQSIEQKCRQDPETCSCSEIETDEERAQCEAERRKGQAQAEEERMKKTAECVSDLSRCDCSAITSENGRKECEKERETAQKLAEKIKKACEKDLGACSCSEIKNPEGKKECESKREKAQKEAEGSVVPLLQKCFKNVDKCDCATLGLPKQEYVDFCETQKSYGIRCRQDGLYCEKLEDVTVMPYGLPNFLAPIFKRTYRELVEKEREKGSREAAMVMKSCILDPENCDCSKTPSYAQAFCEKKKALQIACFKDHYDSCIELENEPNLPEGMPEFSKGMFESIAEGARKIQEGMAKSSAAKNVGSMILECMDDDKKCDCSLAPQGRWKSFCEQKKELIYKCRTLKDYDSCFTLDEDPIVTEDMPDFIKEYARKNVIPQAEEKKKKIYLEMRAGTKCSEIPTLEECKKIMGWNQ